MFLLATAGLLARDQAYWQRLLFPKSCRQREMGIHWIWKLPKILKERGIACDLLVLHTHRLFQHLIPTLLKFQIPQWIEFERNLTEPLKGRKSQKNDRFSDVQRQIRKHRLSFEWTKDPAWLERFYHEMYVPYIQNRHGDEAFIYSFRTIEKVFPHSEILFVKQGELPLGAILLKFEHKRVALQWLGITDGKWIYVKLGVIGALYYFSMIEMKKRGYAVLSLGLSRPFLTDAITNFKISFRARISSQETRQPFYTVCPIRNSCALRRFLIANPFIFYPEKGKPARALFIDNENTFLETEMKSRFQNGYPEGLSGTHVFRVSPDVMPVLIRVVKN